MSSEVKKAKLTDEEYIKKLENALNSAEQRIDKAIEYIENTQYDKELQSHVYGINYPGTKKLLSILKGKW